MSLDRSKLAKVLRLMESSAEGEANAAFAAATRMLRAAGVKWDELAASPVVTAGVSEEALRRAVTASEGWRETAARYQEQLRQATDRVAQRDVEIRALRRRLEEVEARAEISHRESAALRRALGPEKAAQAVLAGNPAVQSVQQASPFASATTSYADPDMQRSFTMDDVAALTKMLRDRKR